MREKILHQDKINANNFQSHAMCIQVVTRKAPPVQVLERCNFSTHRFQRFLIEIPWKTHIKKNTRQCTRQICLVFSNSSVLISVLNSVSVLL